MGADELVSDQCVGDLTRGVRPADVRVAVVYAGNAAAQN
jgi:hypothetical protein